MYRCGLRLWIMGLVVCVVLGGCAQLSHYGPVRVEDYTETIRVACVGDSITFGSGIKDRGTNSYPAQLSVMLGDEWDVGNFGVSGATMLKKGDRPYWREKAFGAVVDFAPHVVVIKLGTNDSKDHWDAENFELDYVAMVEAFAVIETHPRIWLCLPVPVYQDRWQIRESVVREEVIVIIRKVAKKKHLGVIDLYRALGDKESLFPDKIHPNAEGAGLMAGEIRRALTGE